MQAHLAEFVNRRRRRDCSLPALHQAAAVGDLAKVEEIVTEKGAAALVEQDSSGRLPLHLAASAKRVDLLLFLLEHSPEEALGVQDIKGLVPLRYALAASEEGDMEALDLLIDKGEPGHLLMPDISGRNALHHACQLRKAAVVSRVLEHIPREGMMALDQNHYPPAKLAALLFPMGLQSCLKILKLMPLEALIAKDSPGGDSALLNGIQGQGDALLFHFLELAPPDFDFDSLTNSERGFSILHAYAASKGPISVRGLTALLERVPPAMVGSVESRGCTALHFIVRDAANIEVTELLLSRMTPEECGYRCANNASVVHACSSPQVALLVAQHLGKEDLGQLCDSRGFTVLLEVICMIRGDSEDSEEGIAEAALWIIRNLENEDLTRSTLRGLTPLMAAAALGMPTVVEELLQRLSDEHLSTPDKNGCNVLHHCLTKEPVSIPVLELLLNNVPKALRTARNSIGQTPTSMAAGARPSLANYFETTHVKSAQP